MCKDFEPGPHKHTRTTVDGGIEYQDSEGYWMDERDVCNHCREEVIAEGKPFAFGESRNSFGYYAGKYCDACWPKSGYRDAVDPTATFDEDYAGESLHGEPDDIGSLIDAEIDF